MSEGWRAEVKALTSHNILLLLHHMAEGQDRARPGHGNCGFSMSSGRNSEPWQSLAMGEAGEAD